MTNIIAETHIPQIRKFTPVTTFLKQKALKVLLPKLKPNLSTMFNLLLKMWRSLKIYPKSHPFPYFQLSRPQSMSQKQKQPNSTVQSLPSVCSKKPNLTLAQYKKKKSQKLDQFQQPTGHTKVN